jgi:hypothetical protein
MRSIVSGLGAAVLHAAHGVAQRLLGGDLVAAEGHVGDHERPPGGTADEAGVVDDLVDRHRQRRLLPLHHVAEGVAHEQHVDARIEDARKGEIVGGEHREGLAALLAPCERGNGDAVLPRGLERDGGHAASGRSCGPTPENKKRAGRCPRCVTACSLPPSRS